MPVLSTNNLNILIEKIADSNTKSLIIFDINQVLIKEQSSIFNKSGRTLREQLHQTAWKDLTQEQIKALWSTILLHEPTSLLDDHLPTIIKSMQERAIKVIALTSCPIGSYGHIECMATWTIKRLAQHSISFHGSFKEHDPLKLELRNDTQQDTASFQSGILFNAKTVRFSKGAVLASFLNQINWEPSDIIFVDNQLENIESIGMLAGQIDIPFLGIHYTAIQGQLNPYDPDLADFQFRYLRDHGQWLPDLKAKHLINQQ